MPRIKLISIVIIICFLTNTCFQSVLSENIFNPFEYLDKVFIKNVEVAKGEANYFNPLFLTQKNTQTFNFITQFSKQASLSQIYEAVKNFDYKPLGLSVDRMFEIGGVDENTFKYTFKSIIEHTSPIVMRKACRSPNDPQVANQWELDTLNLKNAWNQSVGSNNVKIAVLDSGVDRSTKDLGTTNILPGYDLNTKGAVLSDENGHGTSVISILAASADNNSGMAGVCWRVTVEPYKIYDENDETDTAREIEALKMAAQSGCKIINLSFGGSGRNEAEDEAIQELAAKGILIFAAAGNAGQYVKYYPASNSNVFSIAACDKNSNRWTGSNYDESVDISAPGKDVTVIAKTGTKFAIGLGSGTSFSTPYVAGIMALACSIAPDINFKMVHAALASVCRDLGAVGLDKYYGYGILDAEKLLDYANNNWILKEPVDSVVPIKYTVNSSSQPQAGTMEFTPQVSGVYYIKSLGSKDTDMDVFKAQTDSEGEYSYDLNTPYVGDSLLDADEVMDPFFFPVDLTKGTKYLFDAYSEDKCKGESISFLVFSPSQMLGRSAIISSNNLTDVWSQELVYKARYSGSKSVVLSSDVTGASGGFSIFNQGIEVGKSAYSGGKDRFTLTANEGDIFSIIVHSNSKVVWNLNIFELNNLYNSAIKEINIVGGTLDKAFNSSVLTYNIEATNPMVTIYWLPYFSNITTEINQKFTRTTNFDVTGGAKKTFVIEVEDTRGNIGSYNFTLNADPEVVGTRKPLYTPTPTPTKKPSPVPVAKPNISSLIMVKKQQNNYLSIEVSWNMKASLKLFVLNYKDEIVKTIWTSKVYKAGEKTFQWNLKDSKNVFVKKGLYRLKFVADKKYCSKWFNIL